jgi:hypothetical protein
MRFRFVRGLGWNDRGARLATSPALLVRSLIGVVFFGAVIYCGDEIPQAANRVVGGVGRKKN